MGDAHLELDLDSNSWTSGSLVSGRVGTRDIEAPELTLTWISLRTEEDEEGCDSTSEHRREPVHLRRSGTWTSFSLAAPLIPEFGATTMRYDWALEARCGDALARREIPLTAPLLTAARRGGDREGGVASGVAPLWSEHSLEPYRDRLPRPEMVEELTAHVMAVEAHERSQQRLALVSAPLVHLVDVLFYLSGVFAFAFYAWWSKVAWDADGWAALFIAVPIFIVLVGTLFGLYVSNAERIHSLPGLIRRRRMRLRPAEVPRWAALGETPTFLLRVEGLSEAPDKVGYRLMYWEEKKTPSGLWDHEQYDVSEGEPLLEGDTLNCSVAIPVNAPPSFLQDERSIT